MRVSVLFFLLLLTPGAFAEDREQIKRYLLFGTHIGPQLAEQIYRESEMADGKKVGPFDLNSFSVSDFYAWMRKTHWAKLTDSLDEKLEGLVNEFQNIKSIHPDIDSSSLLKGLSWRVKTQVGEKIYKYGLLSEFFGGISPREIQLTSWGGATLDREKLVAEVHNQKFGTPKPPQLNNVLQIDFLDNLLKSLQEENKNFKETATHASKWINPRSLNSGGVQPIERYNQFARNALAFQSVLNELDATQQKDLLIIELKAKAFGQVDNMLATAETIPKTNALHKDFFAPEYWERMKKNLGKFRASWQGGTTSAKCAFNKIAEN